MHKILAVQSIIALQEGYFTSPVNSKHNIHSPYNVFKNQQENNCMYLFKHPFWSGDNLKEMST